MAIQRMEHVGIVVDDLAAAIDFFSQLGLELRGEASVEADWVDRVTGLDGVRLDIAMMLAKQTIWASAFRSGMAQALASR